ncbi:hypothetical protein V2J09_024043 [Rumex salicifolius]
MAANSKNWESGAFRLFESSDDKPSSGGLGFLDFEEKPMPPPPPCVEVLPSEVSTSVKYTVEQISVGDATLVKGRVSTQEVFALSNSDLVPGKYEGGLKLWEGSLDLIKTLNSEIQNGNLAFEGKIVLELGCGHGLPGIFSFLKGAPAVHFQDFNDEVLQCLTIPNVMENISELAQTSDAKVEPEIRYFAGDWSELNNILPHAQAVEDHQTPSKDDLKGGYDVILMAETVYSMATLPSLYRLIKECINYPHGMVYVAGKKHYFGVGGGTRRFISIVEKDESSNSDIIVFPLVLGERMLFVTQHEGVMDASLIAELADGSSNLRESLLSRNYNAQGKLQQQLLVTGSPRAELPHAGLSFLRVPYAMWLCSSRTLWLIYDSIKSSPSISSHSVMEPLHVESTWVPLSSAAARQSTKKSKKPVRRDLLWEPYFRQNASNGGREWTALYLLHIIIQCLLRRHAFKLSILIMARLHRFGDDQ